MFETWLKSDLKKPVKVEQLHGNLFSADNEGNKIGVEVMDNGSPAVFGGTSSVHGYIIRADGVTVPVNGTLSGNKASIVLPASAYVVVGQASIAIKVDDMTVGACTAYVYRTTTDTIVDPGSVVPSIAELLAIIGECEAATLAASSAASAATSAASSVESAIQAANSAVNSAILATNSAIASAVLATSSALAAAAMIDNMTVSASSVQANTPPTATISEVGGHKHIAFGIPEADTSDKASATISPVIHNDFAESIKTLENCAEGMGMGITIPIFPVQDLHGYEYPWPAGGRKNLLPLNDGTYIVGNTVTAVIKDGVLTMSGTATSAGGRLVAMTDDFLLPAGTYFINTNRSGSDVTVYINKKSDNTAINTGDNRTFTLSEDTIVFAGINVTISTNYNGVTAKPMLNVGSSAEPFSPYSNICPISGYTGVEITRTGGNIYTTENSVDGKYINVDGSIGTDSDFLYTDLFPVEVGKKIYVKLTNPDNATRNTRVHGYDASGEWVQQIDVTQIQPNSSLEYSFVIPTGITYIRISIAKNLTNVSFDMGNTYSITWESAGTVYGGTVTINEDGSGTLSVNRVYATYNGSETWEKGGTGNYFYTAKPTGTYNTADNICDTFEYIRDTSASISSATYNCFKVGDALNVCDMRYSTADEFKAYLESNPVHFALMLTTPVTYTLTPQQITSLLGNTTIWNTIGAFSVSYHEDPKTYVDDTAGIAGSVAVTDSTEEAVKTLSDCADHLPMAVQVGIDPVQDLHGQESPYPGGAGKNLLNPDAVGDVTTGNGTRQGVEYTTPGTYTISAQRGYSSSTGNVYITKYDGSSYTAGTAIVNGESKFNPITITIEEGHKLIVHGGSNISASTVKSLISYCSIMVELGSSATSYAPWENICPITGWTGCELNRANTNLVTKVLEHSNIGGDGVIYDNTSDFKLFIGVVKKGETYTVTTDEGSGFVGSFFASDPVAGSTSYNGTRIIQTSKTITAPITGYMVFRSSASYSNGRISIGSEAVAYESPQTTTIPISWQSTAGTVYGGSLTVNEDGSGVLTAGMDSDTIGSLSWDYNGTRFRAYVATLTAEATRLKGICSIYPVFNGSVSDAPDKSMIFSNQTKEVYIKDSSYSTSEALINGVGSGQIVFKLATPVTYNLTAKQVRSLLGTVNLFADCGNILAVSYHADTKMYIDGKIAELQALILENV